MDEENTVDPAVFTKYSALYDSFYVSKKYKDEFDFIKEKFQLKTGLSFKFQEGLEIGCGTGQFTQLFAKNVQNLLATDINPGMLPTNRKKFENVNFSSMDLLEIAKIDKRFDVIILLFHVFSYFKPKEVDLFVELVRNQLRPGGYLIFDYWDERGIKNSPPSQIQKYAVHRGEKWLRVAKSQTDFNLKKIDVNFEFYKENSTTYEFCEKHEMYYYEESVILGMLPFLRCQARIDSVALEEYCGTNYGNTLIFTRESP